MKTKNLRSFALFLMISMISFGEISAQATLQEAEKELKERASKDAKKEVKKWTKEGYTNMPGQLPLEKQYDRYFQFTLLMDEKMIPKYISSTGTAVASVEDVAIANSLDNARLNLAGQISAQVANLIENNKGNSQLSTKDAESISKFISNSKTLVQNELGTVQPMVTMRRLLKDDKIEVRMEVAYSMDNAKIMAKKLIHKELQDEINQNEQELNKILGIQ